MDFEPVSGNTGTTPVTQDAFNKFQKFFYAVSGGIVLVLAIGYLTLLFSTYSILQESNYFKTTAYEQLNSNVIQLNASLQAEANKKDSSVEFEAFKECVRTYGVAINCVGK